MTVRLAVLMCLCIACASGGTVFGLIVDEVSGVPLTDVKVVIDGGRNSKLETRTGNDGRFLIGNVPPGVYRPTFEKQGYLPPEPSADSLKPISVRSGAEQLEIRCSMAKLGSLRGKVVFDQSSLAVPVTVELRTVRRGGSLLARIAPDGAFSFDSVLPGRYYLAAIPGSYQFATAQVRRKGPDGPSASETSRHDWVPTYYPGVSNILQAQPLAFVRGAQLDGYELSLNRAAVHVVRGRVLDDRRRAVPGATVRLVPARGLPESESNTGANGEFTFPRVRDGEWVLMASTERPGASLAGAAQFRVAGRDPDPVDVQLESPVSVRIKIILDRNALPEPEPNTGFLLIPVTGPSLFSRLSDNGEVLFAGVAPGLYQLAAVGGWKNGYIEGISWDGQPLLGSMFTIPPSSNIELQATFRPGGGAVAGNGCATGGTVVLIPTDIRQVGLFRSSPCNSDGGFHITNVRPGGYSIAAIDHFDAAEIIDPMFWRTVHNRGSRITVEANQLVNVAVSVLAWAEN